MVRVTSLASGRVHIWNQATWLQNSKHKSQHKSRHIHHHLRIVPFPTFNYSSIQVPISITEYSVLAWIHELDPNKPILRSQFCFDGLCDLGKSSNSLWLLFSHLWNETDNSSFLQDPLEEGMATHSSILAWRILWTGEPGRWQFIGSQRLGHDWCNLACTHTSTS